MKNCIVARWKGVNQVKVFVENIEEELDINEDEEMFIVIAHQLLQVQQLLLILDLWLFSLVMNHHVHQLAPLRLEC